MVLMVQNFQTKGKKGSLKNPLDRNGRVSRCAICESIYHWQQDYPNKQNDTYMVHEIVLHNEKHEPGQPNILYQKPGAVVF